MLVLVISEEWLILCNIAHLCVAGTVGIVLITKVSIRNVTAISYYSQANVGMDSSC